MYCATICLSFFALPSTQLGVLQRNLNEQQPILLFFYNSCIDHSGTKNGFEWFQLYNTVFHCTVLHRPYWVHFLWLLEIAPWGNKCKKVSQQCTFEPQLCQLVVLFKTFGKEVSIKDLFDGKTNHNVTTIGTTTFGLELLQ